MMLSSTLRTLSKARSPCVFPDRHLRFESSTPSSDKDQEIKEMKAEIAELRAATNVLSDLFDGNFGMKLLSYDEPTGHKKARERENIAWVVKALGVDRLHEADCDGAGIRIAQPDAGLIHDEELRGALVEKIYHTNGTYNRHGASVATVILSNDMSGHDVVGVAPAAKLYSYKIIDQGYGRIPPVVLFKEGIQNLKKAVQSARDDNDCHILSMSVGFPDPFSLEQELQNELRKCVKEGMILVAAASNHTLGLDVYPAAFPEVISMAACGYYERLEDKTLPDACPLPWRGSAYGDHVDFVAPGDDVWTIQMRENDNPLDPMEAARSAGTSYSAAITAGIAALWLQKHKEGLSEFLNRENAGRSDAERIYSQHLFRAALLKSSREGGRNRFLPPHRFNHGLIDAELAVNSDLKALVAIVDDERRSEVPGTWRLSKIED